MAREPHFVVKYSSYLGTAIKLVLYILKQLFASVSVNSGGYLPRRSGSVNIHRYSPPLRRIIVNYQSEVKDHVSKVASCVRALTRPIFSAENFNQQVNSPLYLLNTWDPCAGNDNRSVSLPCRPNSVGNVTK